MRANFYFKSIFYLIIVIFILEGCTSEEKTPSSKEGTVQKYSMIITPSQGKTIKSGEDIQVEVTLAEVPSDFSKLIIKLDNEIIFTSDKQQSEFNTVINSIKLSMGTHFITSELFLNDSETEVNNVSITITSDIIPKRFSYLVRNTLPHDNSAYTQGLEFKNGVLYEGTGLNGKSELRMLDLRTGRVMKNKKLDAQYFGEGITIIGDKIYQITYQSNIGFVYDLNTFEKLKDFNYTTEGWGLTHIENELVMSDGTNKLYFINSETFERTREIEVFDNVGPVHMINELEFINGEIWANLYLSNEIIRIDPETGKVKSKIDFNGIFNSNSVSYKTDVMNGIAFEKESGKIYLTGKLWPNIYEVEILNED